MAPIALFIYNIISSTVYSGRLTRNRRQNLDFRAARATALQHAIAQRRNARVGYPHQRQHELGHFQPGAARDEVRHATGVVVLGEESCVYLHCECKCWEPFRDWDEHRMTRQTERSANQWVIKVGPRCHMQCPEELDCNVILHCDCARLPKTQ